MKVQVREQDAERRCPYCHGELGGEAPTTCRLCAAHYHAECAVEAQRCAIHGCVTAFDGASSTDAHARLCASCRTDVRPGEQAWTCASCGWTHHQLCFTREGRCTNARYTPPTCASA